jgi:hypothetical protein
MASSIDIRGIQNGILHMGFTNIDAILEVVDNEVDAGATKVRIHFTSATTTISISGNGRGMTKDALKRSMCYFGAKAASEQAGVFGLGETAGPLQLSGGLTPTYTVTRAAGAVDIMELVADWPTSASSGKWEPETGGVLEARRHLWTRFAIDPLGQGSLKHIQMPPEKFAEVVGNLPNLLLEIGFAYESHLRDGKTIEVYVDGVVHSPDMGLTLNYETTPAARRCETPIELWRNGEEERVYYRHSSLKPAYVEMVRQEKGSQTKMRDYATAGAAGFVKVAEFLFRSVYSVDSNPPAVPGQPRGDVVPGYVALCRDRRTLCRLPGLFPGTSGDYEDRRIVGATRHWLSFGYRESEMMGVMVDKSHVREEKVHKLLLDTVHELGRRWSKRYYQTIKAAAAVAPPEGVAWARRVKAACADLKRIAETNPEFLEEIENFISEFEIAEDLAAADDE